MVRGGLDLCAAVLARPGAGGSTGGIRPPRGTVPSPSPEVVMEWNTVFLAACAIAILVGLFS